MQLLPILLAKVKYHWNWNGYPRLFLATTAVSTGILISLAFRDKKYTDQNILGVYFIQIYTPYIFVSKDKLN